MTGVFVVAGILLAAMLEVGILRRTMRQASIRCSRLRPLGSNSLLRAFLGSVLNVLPAGVKIATGLSSDRVLARLVVLTVLIRTSKLLVSVVMLIMALLAAVVLLVLGAVEQLSLGVFVVGALFLGTAGLVVALVVEL